MLKVIFGKMKKAPCQFSVCHPRFQDRRHEETSHVIVYYPEVLVDDLLLKASATEERGINHIQGKAAVAGS